MLVDEKTLWPAGKFVTTLLMVKKEFLDAHPDVIAEPHHRARRLGRPHQDQTRRRRRSSSATASTRSPGKPLKAERDQRVVRAHHVHARPDRVVAADRRRRTPRRSGFLKSSDLGNIFDLTLLNKVLAASGQAGDHRRDRVDRARTPNPSASPAVSIADVSKVFGNGRASVTALDHISLDVAPGEFVCLLGASGCGKSTLLNIVAGLDQPTSGQVERPGQPHRAHVPRGGVVPVADGAGQRRARAEARGRRARRAPRPHRRAARDGAPRRLRQEASARAVGRDAPTGRARPRARAGRRGALDGRAVRRARRDDARPVARRARDRLARDRARR